MRIYNCYHYICYYNECITLNKVHYIIEIQVVMHIINLLRVYNII